MDSIKPPSLVSLPQEILHGILVDCDPYDLASLSRACRLLRGCIRGNKLLHKDSFLNNYDTPPVHFLASDQDWEKHVHDIGRLQKLFRSTSSTVKQSHLADVVSTVSLLLNAAPVPSEAVRHPFSRNVSILTNAFKSHANVNALLCSSSLFGRAGTQDQVPAPTKEARQLSAKLHVLYGVAINSELHPTHHNARSKVYDLRNYTDDSFWGPFLDDRSSDVDWERLEAVMVVLCFNLRQFSNRTHGRFPQLWRTPFLGVQPRSYVSGDFKGAADPDRVPDELSLQDPYGITGTWMRVVCFLDYSDLYTYNFARTPPPHEPREPLDTEEAIRLITMKLKVTKIEEPGEGQGKELPVVYFEGTSRSMHAGWDPNANSLIRGQVHLTPAGEVRWTTWSVFHGEERWRSEGIQIGGIRSARGVWGNWFDKDFDEEGPAGPTAFWKLSDEVPSPDKQERQDDAARQQAGAVQSMLALQHIQLQLHHGSVPNGTLRHHWVAVGQVPIAGASSSAAGTAPNVDADDHGAALHGATHPPPSYYQQIDSSDDSDTDPDFVPPANAGQGHGENEEDDDDDVPPAGEDDIVVEEAVVEEELVPYGDEAGMPDGEEIVVIGEHGGAHSTYFLVRPDEPAAQ